MSVAAVAPRRALGFMRARALRGFALGSAGVLAFLLIWEMGTLLKLPLLANVPAPLEVVAAFGTTLANPAYYGDWFSSLRRVFVGFTIAQAVAIPLGLVMGWRRRIHDVLFPLVEVMRPIPPLAWVPISIVFWPTAESSIAFVIFLGAFFITLINTMAGVRAIDHDYVDAARSFGANDWTIFRRVILPGALPSVFVGLTVGMGITWSVLVAAEIIAGKDGLGHRTWESYVGGAFPAIVVGMISMGVAGYASSSAVRALGTRVMPWTRR